MRAQFDRELVLEDATRLFWQKGYSAASMQQLVEATQLKPGSLYLAFGSKEGLFRASLEYYAKRSASAVRQVLDEAPSVGMGICQILTRMVNESGKSEYCSCFLIKSQLELAATEGDLAQAARDYMGQVEHLFTDYLGREHPPQQAQRYAAALMIQIYGIRVYSYLRRSQQTMLQALTDSLPWLPWHEFAESNC